MDWAQEFLDYQAQIDAERDFADREAEARRHYIDGALNQERLFSNALAAFAQPHAAIALEHKMRELVDARVDQFVAKLVRERIGQQRIEAHVPPFQDPNGLNCRRAVFTLPALSVKVEVWEQ